MIKNESCGTNPTRFEIFLLDSHAYLYKNYFALPKLFTSKGEEVGALYGFLRFVIKILKEKKPKYFIAFYDSPVKTKRKEIYPLYKANRAKTEESLINQIKTSKILLEALGIKTIMVETYEADDLIAKVALKGLENNFTPIIISPDKDLYSLTSNGAFIWDGHNSYISKEEAFNKFKIPPEKIFDYLSLVGDASDNIPGVSGIGPKKALSLIEKYNDVENIIKEASKENVQDDLLKVKKDLDNLNLSKQLIKLDLSAMINEDFNEYLLKEKDEKTLKEFAIRLEFKELYEIEENLLFQKEEILNQNGKSNLIEKDLTLLEEKEALEKIKDFFSFNDDIIFFKEYYIKDFSNSFLKEICLKNNQKYFYDFKKFLHLTKFDFIENYQDLHIAYYLIKEGERNPKLDRIISEYFPFYKNKEGYYFEEIFKIIKKILEEKGMLFLYENYELPLIKVLYEMEENGMLIDKNEILNLNKKIGNDLENIKKEFEEKTKEKINLNSPKQVSNFIYEKLNLPIDEKLKKTFKTKTGYSTNEEVLKVLSPYSPFIEIILKYRELFKLKTSFIEVLIEKLDKDERIRTNFEQTGTVTGRLSSSEPNLQNIPIKSEISNELRKCFIAPENFLLVSLDYSQIDLRVMAHLSEDKNLINAFKNDEDIHIKTACEIFKIKPENVDSNLRRIAKTINFGIIYGQTPMGLSRELNISFEEARDYIEKYFLFYEGVKKWSEETIEFAKKNNYIYNFLGRRRFLPEINSVNRNLRLFAERTAINMPVQSGSSDIIKKAMVNIYKIIQGKEDIKLISQIHDELIFEINKDKIDSYSKILKEEMEIAYTLKVPLKVQIKVGKNLKELKK